MERDSVHFQVENSKFIMKTALKVMYNLVEFILYYY